MTEFFCLLYSPSRNDFASLCGSFLDNVVIPEISDPVPAKPKKKTGRAGLSSFVVAFIWFKLPVFKHQGAIILEPVRQGTVSGYLLIVAFLDLAQCGEPVIIHYGPIDKGINYTKGN